MGITHARINIGWDEMYFLDRADALHEWMEAARNAGVSPLVTFGHSWPTPAGAVSCRRWTSS